MSQLSMWVVPQDYEDLLSYYTKRGYRVIAIAGKSLEGLSWLKAQKMKRLVVFSVRGCTSYIYDDTVNKRNLACGSLVSLFLKTSSSQVLHPLSKLFELHIWLVE